MDIVYPMQRRSVDIEGDLLESYDRFMTKITHAKKLADLPTPHHTAVMDEIESAKQTDRGVAIVGAAYVDLVLRESITIRLLPEPDILECLFENRGPLQDFGARIQVGFALGIYQRPAYGDLRTIKDIRNAFAHSAEAMDFEHPDVARMCANFFFAERIQLSGQLPPVTPRERYVRTIELLTEGLHEIIMRQRNGISEATSFLMWGGSAKTSHESKSRSRKTRPKASFH